ncbi:MAG: CTP synthase [Candidatus Saccharimonadales bacterium]
MKNTPHVTKYIFVTGGVISGVGKGITAASLGALLKSRGLRVTMQKCDPYLNVDAGTLNPAEHGECFVTHDGAETDLDLGHYERFLDEEMNRDSITLSGSLMQQLIADERSGKFLGKTVQLVPHLTDAIQRKIEKAGEGSEVHIVELGGTVGDYEGLSFVEAFREFAMKRKGDVAFVHVVYVPYLKASKEFKTKPAQNAVRDLRGFGISPDIIVARVEEAPDDSIIRKVSQFGGVAPEAVAVLPNADTVLRVPLTLHELGIDTQILRVVLGMEVGEAKLEPWHDVVTKATVNHEREVRVGIVAKYLDNEDTYISVLEALKSAAWHEDVRVKYDWVSAEEIESKGTDKLAKYDGILVPGGFGTRGAEGKIAAADYALMNNVPYLGLCLGLQVAVVAAARRGGVENATSGEFAPESDKQVVYIMEDQKGKESTGGTMRVGDYPARLLDGSKVAELYGSNDIVERHRHRYEVNRVFEEGITKGGLVISGQSPDVTLVEFVEAKDHPYFVATQAHPEFRSRPGRPHPLFTGFIKALK